jgi:DedD protein
MDSRLLKRLVGAAVLIALAVIFVPMLLPGGSSPGSKRVMLSIPPEPSADLQTRVLEVGPGSARAGASTAARMADPDHVATVDLATRHASQPPATDSARAPSSSRPAASGRAKPETSSSQPPASASAPPASVPGGPGAAAGTVYSVNLGVYAKHASAKKLVTAAKKHGFRARTSPETLQGKPVFRVRVGPFTSRTQAEAARLKLRSFESVSSMTIHTSVVNQTHNAPASAMPAGKPGGFAVQVGAFRVENQANMLRDRLRNQGFDAYAENASNSKLWRVRVGPFTSHGEAASALKRIAAKMKLKGIIVTQQ